MFPVPLREEGGLLIITQQLTLGKGNAKTLNNASHDFSSKKLEVNSYSTPSSSARTRMYASIILPSEFASARFSSSSTVQRHTLKPESSNRDRAENSQFHDVKTK